MIARLATLALGNPWVVGSMAAFFIAATAGAYIKGRIDGSQLEAAGQVVNAERVIDGISDVAERARARVRLCRSRGLQHDPESGGCVKQ